MNTIDWQALSDAAAAARAVAYAPYSGYAVGAALLSADGRVFSGCNVENASYPLCLCAERAAIGAAVSQGARSFRAVAVVSAGARAATPCGACRQVLLEFAPDALVLCVSVDGDRMLTDVPSLLPHAFGPTHLTTRNLAGPHGTIPPAVDGERS